MTRTIVLPSRTDTLLTIKRALQLGEVAMRLDGTQKDRLVLHVTPFQHPNPPRLKYRIGAPGSFQHWRREV